ncbi:transcription factor GTE4-like [Rutidosis leptorrhynchoides]|uniref:transcription factor GTE4-like n=1 Tax=Rutidosis leptorrhynchoides TaxID=125765 RepID=UPI003A99C46C
MEFVGCNKVKINLGCITGEEARTLKRQLLGELEKVRSLVKQLDKEEASLARGPQLSGNERNRAVGGLTRVNSEVGSVGLPNSLSLKEKKSAKGGDQHRKNSDGKGKSAKHGKLPSAVDNNRMVKSKGDTLGFSTSSPLYKSCRALLDKLMKHKFSWVFNEPVDAKKLGLHDYFTIVKHPMDLGTVKSRLSEKWYKSAKDFAEDVRLTFNNAMLYNPKGQDVYYMADQMSKMFADKWKEIESKFNLNENLPTPTSRVPSNPVSVPTPRPTSEKRTLEIAESRTTPVDSKLTSGGAGDINRRTPVPEKPNARDVDERDMSYDEKQRLSTSLQSMPSEKLDNVVEIIKKRNPRLCEEDDDIEVDLDSLDPGTLWELDRFVTNYWKNLSKNKRKAEYALPETEEADDNIHEEHSVPPEGARPTLTDAGEKANASASPIRGEQQGDNGNRSSSSGSSSSDSGSSSSDSDTDSSSGSGSNAGH